MIDAGKPVTLVHSHAPNKVAKGYDDFCHFINSNISKARMVFQRSPGANYEMLFSRKECETRMNSTDPRLCRELDWESA